MKRIRNDLSGYLFILPGLIGFFFFTLGPTIFSLILSFTKWDILSPIKFVGFSNFIKLLGFHKTPSGIAPNDPYFWYYLWNTIFFMLFLTVLRREVLPSVNFLLQTTQATL